VLLTAIKNRFGWDAITEKGNIIGLRRLNCPKGGLISLEPGGQLELSGAPLKTVHETAEEVHQHFGEVRETADALGIGFLGLGFSPKWTLAETPVMPKARYRIMLRYMPMRGKHGLDMMFRTSTVQVNLDFGGEADMLRKMRVGLALQPIATALFANSPFTDGKPNGFQSYRAEVWRDTDPDRTGLLPFAFSGHGLRALCGLRPRCADVFRLPQRPLYRRGWRFIPRLHARTACGAARRTRHARRLGRPSHHALPRCEAEALPRNARR
jgi:glutamate--cysteine ligase